MYRENSLLSVLFLGFAHIVYVWVFKKRPVSFRVSLLPEHEHSPLLAILRRFRAIPAAISYVTSTVFVIHPFNHGINITPTTLPTLRQLNMIIIIKCNFLNLYTINTMLLCDENYNMIQILICRRSKVLNLAMANLYTFLLT